MARQFYYSDPDQYAPDLAGQLEDYGTLLHQAKYYKMARRVLSESANMTRELHLLNPEHMPTLLPSGYSGTECSCKYNVGSPSATHDAHPEPVTLPLFSLNGHMTPVHPSIALNFMRGLLRHSQSRSD